MEGANIWLTGGSGFTTTLLTTQRSSASPAEMFRLWINVLCLASANEGRIPSVVDTAFSLRMTEKQAEEGLNFLISAGLVDQDENGRKPHNWENRQFKSDLSTERVKRFRNVSKAVSETGPDSDQTRPESDNNKNILEFVVGKRAQPKPPLTDDYKLAKFQELLAEKMGEHGWYIVGIAADPSNPNYSQAVEQCKRVAKAAGKGWPHQWPRP